MENKEELMKSCISGVLIILISLFIALSILPISIFFGDILGTIIALMLATPFFAYFYLTQNKGFSVQKKKSTVLCVILFLIVVWTVPQSFTISTIENEAQQQIENYSFLAENTLKGDPLLVSWNLTTAYNNGYLRTYHVKDKTIIARKLANCCSIPFFFLYYIRFLCQ